MLCAEGAPPPLEWVEPSDEAALRWVHAHRRARPGAAAVGLRGPNALAALRLGARRPARRAARQGRWHAGVALRRPRPPGPARVGRHRRERGAETSWPASTPTGARRRGSRASTPRCSPPARTACAELASPPPRPNALLRLRARVAGRARLRRRLRPGSSRPRPTGASSSTQPPARRARCAARDGVEGGVLRGRPSPSPPACAPSPTFRLLATWPMSSTVS